MYKTLFDPFEQVDIYFIIAVLYGSQKIEHYFPPNSSWLTKNYEEPLSDGKYFINFKLFYYVSRFCSTSYLK